MIETLNLIHLSKDSGLVPRLAPHLENLQEKLGGSVFALATCQRTILFGHGPAALDGLSTIASRAGIDEDSLLGECDLHQGPNAYRFLLEVLLGLKSQVVGEYEIVGQFRKAYQDFSKESNLQTGLLTLLEKLLKDAKEVRTKHLLNIGQQTYASITRRLCQTRIPAGSKVLLVGSGELAHDFIRIATKKFDVTIMARNTVRASELAELYGAQSLPLSRLDEVAHEYACVVNTVGVSDLILFDQEFFNRWSALHPDKKYGRLFVDLGSPSSVQSNLSGEDALFRLGDIFKLSETVNAQTKAKISAAKSAAVQLAMKCAKRHSCEVPKNWEEVGEASFEEIVEEFSFA